MQANSGNPGEVTKEEKPNDLKATLLDTAMTKNVAPANAAALLTTTVAGFFMTVVGDIFGAALPNYALALLAATWVVAMIAVLALVGRGPDPDPKADGTKAKQGAGFFSDPLACLKLGWKRSLNNKKYAFVLVLMSFCAAYSAYAQSRSRLDNTTIISILESILAKLSSGEKQLVDMGYSMSDEHAWRALADGNIEAMTLMQKLNRKHFPVNNLGSTSALEGLILKPQADIDGALEIAKLETKDLDQSRHIESLYTGAFKIPDRSGMYESMGFTVVRVIPPPAQRGTATYFEPDDKKPWMAEVPPLLLAAWAKNEDAVEALLKHGAKADAVTVLTTHTYGLTRADKLLVLDLKASALSEARRLGLKRAEAALVKAGATEVSRFEVVK